MCQWSGSSTQATCLREGRRCALDVNVAVAVGVLGAEGRWLAEIA